MSLSSIFSFPFSKCTAGVASASSDTPSKPTEDDIPVYTVEERISPTTRFDRLAKSYESYRSEEGFESPSNPQRASLHFGDNSLIAGKIGIMAVHQASMSPQTSIGLYDDKNKSVAYNKSNGDLSVHHLGTENHFSATKTGPSDTDKSITIIGKLTRLCEMDLKSEAGPLGTVWCAKGNVGLMSPPAAGVFE